MEVRKAEFSASEIRQVREKLGISQEKFAELLGISMRTVCRMEAHVKVSKHYVATLKKLKVLKALLSQLSSDKDAPSVAEWLLKGHPSLYYHPPASVLGTEFGEKALPGLLKEFLDKVPPAED